EAGIPIGVLNDYIPRQMSDKYRELLNKKNAAPLGTTGALGGTASPMKHRYAFYEEVLDPATGRLVPRFRDIMSINRQMAEELGDETLKVFEDDPFAIVSEYARTMNRTLSNATLRDEMIRLGLAIDAGGTE